MSLDIERIVLVLSLVVAGTSCGGDEVQRCSGDDDCREPLVCHYGRCRSECEFDRDCGEGLACVAVAGSASERVCTTMPSDTG